MIYLIIGFLIGTIGLNVLELFANIIEWLKAQVTIKIAECNVQINTLNAGLEETHTQVTGFVLQEREEDDDQDEY